MSLRSISFYVCVMTAVILYGCIRRECRKDPQKETNGIHFYLKDRVTGNDIYAAPTTFFPAPDSVKLIDLRTNQPYALNVGLGPNQTSVLFSNQYRRIPNITDTLIFKFGNAIPDTLIVFTGIVKGWRGEECPYINDAGITKVTLRNQVLVETEYDDAVFTLLK